MLISVLHKINSKYTSIIRNQSKGGCLQGSGGPASDCRQERRSVEFELFTSGQHTRFLPTSQPATGERLDAVESGNQHQKSVEEQEDADWKLGWE